MIYNKEQKDVMELVPQIKFTDIDKMSAQELIKLAEENYELMNYDKCYILFEEAINRNPKDENSLCSFAYFLADVKDKERAKKLLLEAILINPDGNHKKYLHIAELFEGEESAQLYLKAVQIISDQLKINQATPQNEASTNDNMINETINIQKGRNDNEDTIKDLSQAYSALGELYMTDLGKIPNAINICKDYLLKSIEIDQNNLDGYLQLGNYYIEVDDPDSSQIYMNRFIDKYKVLNENESFSNDYPYEMLLHAVRTLIEIQNYDNTLVILEDLIQDNEHDSEVLYLLAYCNFMLKNYLTTEEYIEELNKIDLNKDQEILAAKNELEIELKKVDATKGNDYEEMKEESISNNSMDVE